ncbi:MAG: PKD domain-containing protein [Akkermansiaceae bacterium]
MKNKCISVFILCLVTALVAHLIQSQQTDLPRGNADNTVAHEAGCGCENHTVIIQSSETAKQLENKKSALVARAETATRNFDEWLSKESASLVRGSHAKELIERGLKLAKERKIIMKELMKDAPEEALKRAITWADYKYLPEEIRGHVETPFSELGDFNVLPVCGMLDGGEKGFHKNDYELELSTGKHSFTTFDRRDKISSKKNTPLQGIRLDGIAVARPATLQLLSKEDYSAIRNEFKIANKDVTLDFSTGEKISGDPVVALGGGRIFYFDSQVELEETNKRLAALDKLPGPHSGAQVIFLQASGGADDPASAGLDWSQLESNAELQASAWTETEKKVFFIRIEFSDNTGESVSQMALENILDTTVSNSIRDMSYGKTWINAEVSSQVVQVGSMSTYLPSNNSLLHSAAKSAFDALNTGIDLNSYDIVGVHFKSIGMTSSGGLNYAGLAGGDRQWLQGTTSPGVIIHEFGHNYGLGHASFWDTGGASVVGTGSNEEYGNDFDIMGNGPDPEGHFHPQAKQKLAWLDASDWQDTAASGSGTYRLYRGDNVDTTGIRGIRVPKDTSINHHYWIGHRRAITTNEYLLGGVVLNWEQNGRSWLIDTTPGSAPGKTDSGVLIGQTYSDTTADIHITPVAQGGSSPDEWVDVTVNIGAFPGNSAPTGTLTGPSTGDARSPLTFSVSASDSNGDTLAYSWDFGDGPTALNQSSITRSWDYGGSYAVSVTITDMKGGSVTKTMNVSINDPLSIWTVGNVGQTATMREAAYLNGRYILTGNRYAYFSLDGVTWTRQELALNFRAGGIAYGAGKYVITGYDWNGSAWVATAFHSNDGKAWSNVTVPALESMNDVAFGNGMFMAVGDSGNVMYSSDGVSWTAGTATGSENLDGVAFANGEFIAVGDNKVYATSNGVSWVDRSGSTGLASWQSFRDIFHTGGRFYAGGWYSGIRYSSDQGVTWQAASMPAGEDYDIRAIRVDSEEALLVAVAERKSDDVGVILLSADGISWQEAIPTSFVYTETLAFGNGIFLSTQGTSGATQYSNNIYPANQAPVTSISGSTSAEARELVQFTSTSSDADGDELIHIWDFQDGTELVTGTTAYHSFPTGGSFNVKLTVVDGRGGSVTDTLAITVTDPLNTWTQRTSGTTADLYDVAVGGGKLVAVGGSGNYRVSTDATTWDGGTIGSNINHRGITYDGSQFVACGYDYDFDISAWVGVIYTSPDGLSWTEQFSGGSRLRDIAFGGGVIIASGDGGTLLRSTNGVSWSSVTSGVSTNLQGVSYGDGGFVVVGANSSSQGATILKSSDGLAWVNTSVGAGTSQGFFHTEYLNNLFFASGFYTRLRYSDDNGDTFTDTGEGNLRTPAMAYGNGVYFASGWDSANSGTKLNRLSTDGMDWSELTAFSSVDQNAAVFFQNTFMTVGDNGEIWQSNAIDAPTGWTIWQAEQFPGYPALSGAYDDYDGDGIANLLEYIMGTLPTDSASYVKPALTNESGYMTLTVNKAPSIDGFALSVEGSSDLSNWNTSGLTVVTDNASLLKVRMNQMATDPAVTKYFLRAKATVSP